MYASTSTNGRVKRKRAVVIINYSVQTDYDEYFGYFNQQYLSESLLWRESQPMDEPIREVNRIKEYRAKRDIIDGLA